MPKNNCVPVTDESNQQSSQGGVDSDKDEQEGNAIELDDESTAVVLGEEAGAAECEKDLFNLIDHGIEVQARWSGRISSIPSHLQQQEEEYHDNK